MTARYNTATYRSLVFLAFLAGCFVAFLVTTKSTVSAQDVPAVPYKIGVVDLQMIMANYDKRKEKYAELQKEVDELQKGIDALSQKIETMKKDYEAKKDQMTDEQRSEMRTQIETEYTNYRAELEKRQRLIDSKEERVLKEIFSDIDNAIQTIADKEGYHLVLNAKSGPRGSVLYSSPTIDITSKVLVTLQSSQPAAAGTTKKK